MKFIKAIVLIILFAFAIVFVLQNKETFMISLNFKFNLFGWKWTSVIPVYSAIVCSFVIGAFLVLISFMFDAIKKRKELKMYRERIEELEDELDSIQNVHFEEGSDQYGKTEEKEPSG